mgnify:CR=1 FL=1
MFSQKIVDGFQVEHPDYWLTFGNPWEIERLDVFYPVYFGGSVQHFADDSGNWRVSASEPVSWFCGPLRQCP